MRFCTRVATLLAFFSAGCLHGESPLPATPALEAALGPVIAAAARANQRIHNSSTLRDEEKALLREDLAFCADTEARGAAAAFSSRMHPEGKMFPKDAPVVIGPEAIAKLFAGDTGHWAWAPVDVIASGDTGTTWGIAVISFKDDKGQVGFIQTRYVTVWRKDATGTWKIWADLGERGPPPPEPASPKA